MFNRKEYDRVYHKKYRAEHPEKVKIIRKRWHLKHPNYNKEYYQKHKKELRERYRKYSKQYRNTKRGRALKRHKEKVRYYREKGIEGSHTLNEWEELKKKYNYCCANCGRQEPFTDLWYQMLTEDHIVPVSKGGTNYIENIRPLCVLCNSIKSANLEKD